jgi:hypothetical protein
LILATAIGFPAKHANHAKTKGEMNVREERRLHPTGERQPQRRQGFDAAVLSVFSVFGGLVLTCGNKSTADRMCGTQEKGFSFVSQAIEFSLVQEFVDEREARGAKPAPARQFD